ncbi:MAG: twin-arginine translocation signal domain-containing protein [Ignavibacteria bacterium]
MKKKTSKDINSDKQQNKSYRTVSRRSFLKLSAAAAAATGLDINSAFAEGADELPKLLPVPDKPGFEHLVVLMFENRSFDNILGHLYPPDKVPDGQNFNGIANGSYSNPFSRRTCRCPYL